MWNDQPRYTSICTAVRAARTAVRTNLKKLAPSCGVILLVASIPLTEVTFAVQPTAALAFVQYNSTVPQTPQTTVSLAYTQAQTAGDLNVVVVGWNDSTAQVSTVTDSQGNFYVAAVGPTVQSGTATQVIYYAKNIVAAGANGNTVTVTFNTAAAYPDIRIAEYSGIDPTTPVDTVAAAQGSGTTSSSGSVTTGNANDLLMGANLVLHRTTGPGSGYTSRGITNPDSDILEDAIVTTTGSYSATAPVTGGAWIMQMVAFRAVGSGVATSPSITKLTPTSGTVGTLVTITGTKFGATQGTSTVTFNGTAATPTSWSGMSIGVPVPSGATTGNVVVTVGGTGSNGVSFAVTPAAPLGFVQYNSTVPPTPQTTGSLAYTQAQTAGDLNVVVVGWNDSTAQVSTVTDSQGNFYVAAVGPTVQSGTATQVIYYAKNIVAAGANRNTVTVTFNTAAAYPDIRIAEYSGINPTTPVDTVAAAQGSGTTSSSGSVTTGNANDLLVGANLVQQSTTGPGSGYTSRGITNPDSDILEDAIVTTTGSYSATAPVTGGTWIMQMVAFRAAGSGVATSPSITATPASVLFANVPMGTSDTQTIQLRNAGTSSVMISSLTTQGTGFGTSGLTVPLTLAAGGTATFNVTFSPTNTGTFGGMLTLAMNGTGSGLLIPLVGSAIAATRVLSANPTSVNSGNVAVGGFTTSYVTLENTGNSSIIIQGMSTNGTGFSAIGVSGGTAIAPGQTAMLAVEFAPKNAGTVTGTITISSNAANASTITIPVTGTGVTPTSTNYVVQLNWGASPSAGVVGYNIYRSTVSGGPYANIVSSPASGTSYSDQTVQGGIQYYYVVTSVTGDGMESSPSNQATALIP